MALSAGTRLGPYEILEPLGAGGMGEVFRAHDEKLDRDVALKVLPEGALGDEEARKRFRKEAHALSRLSHPHIATILDFDTQDGTDYLAMELVRGHSLRDELEARGPLPEKTVVRLGAQIAHGLQAAHEQGVIHRDLKPSNLQLTPDGLVKILDFGLARFVATGAGDSEETAPTETAVGRAAGTLPYMSPEQLRGRGVDARTDLYAAGAVLYELATGRRVFTKESAAELTEAILSEEPAPPRTLNERLTPGLEAVILKALDKDAELRYQTAKDLLVDLERLQQRPDSRSSGSGPVEPPGPRPARRRARSGRMTAAAVVVALLGGTAWLLWPSPPPRVTNVRPLGLDVGEFMNPFWPTWTTDGIRLYYVARRKNRYALYHVALSGGEPAEIPTPFGEGLELYGYLRQRSALIVLARAPDLSATTQNVWLVPLPRGTPRPLGDLRANLVAVSPDEDRAALTILEARESRIAFVRLDDPLASPYAELRLPAGSGFGLRWSPDGERVRFAAPGPAGHEVEQWVWETSDAGEPPRPLWVGNGGDWTPDGDRFAIVKRHPVAPRSDLFVVEEERRLPWSVPSLTQLTSGPTSFSWVGAHPDGSGLLAFGAVRRGELQRFDRRTRQFAPFLDGESLGYVEPSPDGQWLVWTTFPEETLWRSRPDGSERLRLTEPPDRALFPVWSPDGTQIAFVGIEGTDVQRRSLRLVSAHGGAVEILAADPATRYWNPCWLPDGRSLLFCEAHLGRPGILRLEVSTGKISRLEGAEDLLFPRGGPQGQILAARFRDGRPRAVVRRPGQGDWEEVGPGGLAYPTWTRDGQAFCGLDFRANRIDCYSLTTERRETLVEIGDQPLLTWVAVPWMGLDAEDNPLVMFDRSTRDLYALDWEAP